MLKQKLTGLCILCMLVVSACAPAPVADPTLILEPTQPGQMGNLPQTEADVPRITVGQARAALESGAAIILDVRSRESFLAGHIPGALSIPLTFIESDPAGLTLDKARWIITYCT